MSIIVHNPHELNSLLADSNRVKTSQTVNSPKQKLSKTNKYVSNCKSVPCWTFHHPADTTTSAKLREEEIQRECYQQLRSSETLYRQLQHTEDSLVKNLEGELIQAHEEGRRKYKTLFTKWEDTVFNKLQEDIGAKMSSKEFRRLDSHKRKLFSRYLDTCNAKGNVFLDIISTPEYNPLILKDQNISLTIPKSDPTKLIQSEQRLSENIESGCGFDVIQRSSTSRGDCEEWIRLPIKDVDSNVRQRSRQRMIDRSHCSVPCTDIDELNIPKRKHAIPNYSLHRPLSQMFY